MDAGSDPVREALQGVRATLHEVVAWAVQEGVDPVAAVTSVLQEVERGSEPPEPVLSSPARAEGITP